MTTSKGECRATISSDLSRGALGRAISQTSRVKKSVDNGVASKAVRAWADMEANSFGPAGKAKRAASQKHSYVGFPTYCSAGLIPHKRLAAVGAGRCRHYERHVAVERHEKIPRWANGASAPKRQVLWRTRAGPANCIRPQRAADDNRHRLSPRTRIGDHERTETGPDGGA
jgi:hypothetical protein